MRNLPIILLTAVVAAIAFGAAPASAQPNCSDHSNSVLLSWPDSNPVWELCWRRPSNSIPQPDGSGIEILDAWYNGHKVLERMHMPILNVEYGPGGCGCFRDWLDSERRFEAIGSSCGSGCIETTQPPRTVCDCQVDNTCDENPDNVCNVDLGSFTGVAIENLSDRVVLTSQTSAGWYRYRPSFAFFADGRIEPEIGFGATPNGCTNANHFHHGYWRIDFDIDDATNDEVSEFAVSLSGFGLTTGAPPPYDVEEGDYKEPGTIWDVRDSVSGRGYRIIPGPTDHLLQTSTFDPKPFAKGDYWVLRYDPNEIDDGINFGGGCSTVLDNFVDGEDVNDADIVFWYRAGALHPGAEECHCDKVGPIFRPIGDWSSGAP